MTRGSVLVTGGRGFAASHLIGTLRSNDYEVISLVRDNIPHERATDPNVTEVYGDIRDVDLLYRVLVDYSVTHVAHLAAQAIVPKALDNPFETWEANARGTYTVLEACRRYGKAEGIIVQSSDKALGTQPDLPYTESAPLNGIYPYDASKAASELIARSYHKTFGLPIVISRCANLYGPGDRNRSRIIPDTVVSTLQGQRVTIRSDGTPQRDFLFIQDAVYGLRLLLEEASQYGGEVFHFGTGMPISVLDLVTHILQTMKRTDLQPVILKQARGEIDVQYLSAEKARRLLKWEPSITLDRGLAETIVWWRKETGIYDQVYSYEIGLI